MKYIAIVAMVMCSYTLSAQSLPEQLQGSSQDIIRFEDENGGIYQSYDGTSWSHVSGDDSWLLFQEGPAPKQTIVLEQPDGTTWISYGDRTNWIPFDEVNPILNQTVHNSPSQNQDSYQESPEMWVRQYLVDVVPNPADEGITIQYTQPVENTVQFQVVSLEGVVLYNSELTTLGSGQHSHYIPVASWSPGQYLVKAITPQLTVTMNFIKR
jgi:hypothetical protein